MYRDRNAVTLKMSAKYRHAKAAQLVCSPISSFVVDMIFSRNDS